MIDNTNEQSATASAELHWHEMLDGAFSEIWEGWVMVAIVFGC